MSDGHSSEDWLTVGLSIAGGVVVLVIIVAVIVTIRRRSVSSTDSNNSEINANTIPLNSMCQVDDGEEEIVFSSAANGRTKDDYQQLPNDEPPRKSGRKLRPKKKIS